MHKTNHSKTSIRLNDRLYDAISGKEIIPGNTSIDGILTNFITKESGKTVKRQPQRSQTLMRTAVHKPDKTVGQVASISTPLEPTNKLPKISSSVSINTINTPLAKRAALINPHSKISRFGNEVKTDFSPKLHSIAQHPQTIGQIPERSLIDQADLTNVNSESQNFLKLSKKELRTLKNKKSSNHRIAAFATVSLMGLLIIGYAIYSSMPNIMAKIASVRAGFSTVLPSYIPAGYALNSIYYQPGAVSFNFKNKSNSSSSTFALVERSSNWNSTTLASDLVIPTTGQNYRKIVVNGQDVYLFDKDQAAWVQHGIWFDVKGNGNLSTNQLVKLVTTL